MEGHAPAHSGGKAVFYQSTILMIIISVIISYYVMTVLITRNVTHNRNKFYAALYMGAWMGLVMIGIHVLFGGAIDGGIALFAAILAASLVVLAWAIREQKGINQKEFMLGMIEHHEMALAMTAKQRGRNEKRDPRLDRIMDNIMTSQQEEIDEMTQLLQNR